MNQKKVGVLITYLSMGIRILIGFVYTPFMLSRVGDNEYGIYSLSLSLISFITLLDLGLGQTLVRYIAKARALNNKDEEAKLTGFFLKLYVGIAAIALVIGLGMILIYPAVCKTTMSEYELRLFRMVFSVLLVDTVLSFPFCVFTATINAYERFFFQKSMDLIMLILKYAAMTLFLLLGYKVFAITLITTIASISLKLSYCIYCKKKIGIRFDFGKYNMEIVKEIFWFSFFILLNLLIDFLYNSTDKLVLGALQGTAAVTLYSFGVYFHTYFQELSTAMSGVFMPKIVYLYEHDKDQKGLSDLFLRVGRLQMIVLMLALSGFVVYGKEFIKLWIGESYVDAYYIGMIIMLPTIVPLTQNIGISILRAMNLHKHRSYMYLVIAILNVMVSIPLAKIYSAVGAAIGTCMACILGQILFMNWYYKTRIHIDILQYWKSLLIFAAFAVPEAAAAMLLKPFLPITGWGTLVLHVAGYSAIYAALFWFIVANTYEKDLVKSFGRKLLRWKK